MAASAACADFFVDDSHLIEGNGPRLSYGVAVTDLDGNNVPEFIVTGFGYPNLALEFTGTRLSDVMSGNSAGGLFSDAERKTIGVSACDVDGDGREEIYFLNTDSYSGEKLLADRLLDFDSGVTDLFEQGDNWVSLNLTAGRSVACVDREGDGLSLIHISEPTRPY